MSGSDLTASLVHRSGDHEEESCAKRVLCPTGRHCVLLWAGALFLSWVCLHHHDNLSKEPLFRFTLPWEAVAVTAAVIATLNGCHHFAFHLFRNKNSWALKSPVLMILSMVPVYAICSASAIIGMRGKHQFAIILNALREFYEAFVLVAFMQFLAEFWGGTVRLARVLDTDEMTLKTVFPTIAEKAGKLLGGCVNPTKIADLRVFPIARAPGSDYVASTYLGALQYAVVMCIYALVTCIIWMLLLQNQIEPESKEICEMVMKFVKAASNLWAMYNLLILFEYLRESQNTHQRMDTIRPISKFVCIKLIVIFSLWQENLIMLLAKKGMLPTMFGWHNETVDIQEQNANAAINVLVCLEMVLFAQWHRYAYPYDEDWAPPPSDQQDPAYRPNLLLRCNVFKMTDDIGYLYNKRVRGQKKAIALLRHAKATSTGDMSSTSDLARNFRYFELDRNGEASLAQLQFMLAKSGVAQGWDAARAQLREADRKGDGSGRLSYEEFISLVASDLQLEVAP